MPEEAYQPSPNNLIELASLGVPEHNGILSPEMIRVGIEGYRIFTVVASFPKTDLYLMTCRCDSYCASGDLTWLLAANDKRKELFILNCAHSGSIYEVQFRISNSGKLVIAYSNEPCFPMKFFPFRLSNSSISLDKTLLSSISEALRPFRLSSPSSPKFHLRTAELIETSVWSGLRIVLDKLYGKPQVTIKVPFPIE